MNIDDTLESLMNNEMLEDFMDIHIDDSILNNLYEYQHKHIYNLICVLMSKNVVIDGSDTGTGKTYTSISLCKHFNLRPFILCPKTIIHKWLEVAKKFKVNPLGIVNYETIKKEKYYNKGKRVKCPYIQITDKGIRWNLPKKSILIFDEVHKCNNQKSLNGKLLMASYSNKKTLLLSATLADTPKSFHIYGYLLKFYPNIKRANSWIKNVIKVDSDTNRMLSTIYSKIYPTNGSRMTISELGELFPQNQISADCYDVNHTTCNKMNTHYKHLNELTKKLKDDKCLLKDITEARMNIELLKIQLIVDLVKDYQEHNYSIVIFVNYIKSLKQLSKYLKTDNILYGKTESDARIKMINDFQKNKIKLIICISSVGGQSISLHDTIGNSPRVTIISPSYSINTLIQVLGRTYRAGVKSNVLQRILFCANTFEEKLCQNLINKLDFINNIDDPSKNNDMYIELNKLKR